MYFSLECRIEIFPTLFKFRHLIFPPCQHFYTFSTLGFTGPAAKRQNAFYESYAKEASKPFLFLFHTINLLIMKWCTTQLITAGQADPFSFHWQLWNDAETFDHHNHLVSLLSLLIRNTDCFMMELSMVINLNSCKKYFLIFNIKLKNYLWKTLFNKYLLT